MNNLNSQSLNGLTNIYADDIECNTFENIPINYYTGVKSNLQNQIDIISNQGGGYFSILCGIVNNFSTTSQYWNFGGGGVSSVNVPIVHSFAFKVNSITITCQTIPTTSATVYLLKNGTNVYRMSNISTTSTTFSNINISFLANDSLNMLTFEGAGGTTIRCAISCQVGGVTGPTPQLSVGTVSSLVAGSQPTVSITGTTLNPVLNFGLVNGTNGTNGINGATGPKGDTGSQGPKGDTGSQGPKGDTGSSSAQTDLNTIAITGLVATCAGLQTEIDGLGASVVTLQGEIDTIGGEITTINDEITSLEGKTQYMTANTTTISTNFASKLSATGDITTNGNISATGFVNGTNISTNATSTTLSSNSTTTTTILGASIYLGSYTSVVYVNNVPLTPFSSASSFFNQW